jgi:eukaryotic-like serine/threonine-protein kinase
MSDVRWRRIEEICHGALARDAGERAAFVREACGGDESLRLEVESLLVNATRAKESGLGIEGLEIGDLGLELIGQQVGVYKIVSLLGAGGMGEVYRARDTKLGRDVAIKILPQVFTSDPERLARFEREARALATLNHPNIGAIYGFEDANGIRALVLELVEGDTLADCLARAGRTLSLDVVLLMVRQIAEALAAAHEKGIVHRDLKPANIKIRPDGTVKVLDFGLAKAVKGNDSGPNLTQSLNITADGTRQGMILGTPAYMSPEQARGQAVDKRTDVWSLGCVWYEMMTGRPPFDRNTVSDTVAAIIEREPDWSALPSGLSPTLTVYLQRCLQKNPRDRVHDVSDLRLALEGAFDGPAVDSKKLRRPTRAIPWIVAALFALALLVAQIGSGRNTAPERPVTRLELTLPPGIEPYIGPSAVAFSPDGTRVAFVGIEAGNRLMYMRRLDEFEAVPVRGTEGATAVFFSPDGRSIAVILTDRTLKKVSLENGLVVNLASEADYTTGGAWGSDDRITFGRKNVLWQVSASGGSAETQLTTLDGDKGELLHTLPTVVAGGKAILFATVTGVNRGAAHIEALSLAGAPRRHKVIDSGTSPAYVENGHLVFFRDGTLLATPFDEERLQVTGSVVKVIDRIGVTSFGAPMLAVSRSGSVAYTTGTPATRLVWVSRQGLEQPLTDAGRQYVFPRLALDSRHVVVSAGGDLWIQDTARPALTKLTTGATTGNSYVVWTPDAKRIVFWTSAGLYWMDAEGSGRSQAIPETTASDYPNSVSPDGETLIFLRTTADKAADLYVLSLQGQPRSRPLVSTQGHEGGGQFSPDGKWVAYSSNESGQFQVFLRPFPGPDRRWVVSQAGKYVTWNGNGKELFYREGNKMMAVDVLMRNGEPVFSTPRLLFEQRYEFGPGQTISNYDVSPDGQRFVMVKGESGSSRLNVVLNGFNQLVPPK